MRDDHTPPQVQAALKKAERLERWSICWTLSVILVMGLTMGSSQAMRTAWIEDCLSLVAPLVFLAAARVERLRPTAAYPNGYERASSLAFAIAAAALTALGAFLLFDAVKSLLAREHATVAGVQLFGREVWLGWIMVAAQVYSVIVPFVLGRLKLPLARTLMDKTLYTDAKTQKADWMTGVAGIGGVLGIGMGWWWADAAAAALISLDILIDGVGAVRSATAELLDGAPRALESADTAEDADAVHAELTRRFPGAEVRLRETGRVMRAQVVGAAPPEGPLDPRDYWPGDPDRSWRLAHISFVPPPPKD